ncbi:MAG: argininosuccinate lyase [Anaerolineae bacterium]|nr:MAG: argininosuccinate lyase [Anaerolineae bacterium]
MTHSDPDFPHPRYAEYVLKPSFAEAQTYLFDLMMAANMAHAVMLTEAGILSPEGGAALLRGLGQVEAEGVAARRYEPGVEDLFFSVENRLVALVGPEIGGNLQIARSRNDLGAALARMALRDRLRGVLDRLHGLRAALLNFARLHVDTVMPGYTHTQPAQPTTLAHYVAAILSFLARDTKRLQSAYVTTNRSPLGAAAFTTTGFPINRSRIAALLGFDGLIENSHDAIGAADYMTEAMGALTTLALNLSRVTRDLLFWATQEAAAIRIHGAFIQISSIMPQKRNPVVLEHLRARLGRLIGLASSVSIMAHNVPYGDTQDIEDEIYSPLFGACQTAGQVLALYTAVFETLEVNREHLLTRAASGFTTATELADTLTRDLGLPFRTAHGIVSRLVQSALARGLTPDDVTASLLDEAAQAVIGRPLGLPEETVSRALDPVHFTEVRTQPGGPAPATVHAWLDKARRALAAGRDWLATEKARQRDAAASLAQRVEALTAAQR